ncbi:MAG: fibronectin type III domain-containing protein [Planctomycetes bacterium]|nr:fibronectin type III domain-containing protein [Planctomycetota bacterium]
MKNGIPGLGSFVFVLTTFFMLPACGGGGSDSKTPAPTPGLNVPQNVTVTAGNGSNLVEWTAIQGATGYNVYFSTVAGASGSSSPTSSLTNSYSHSGLTNGTTYYYTVRANVDGVLGDPSVEVNGTPTAAASAPNAPQGLTVTSAGSTNIITWAPVAGVTYDLYWNTRSGVVPGDAGVTRIAGIATGYSHTSLTNGVTYYYVLVGRNPFGSSLPSNEVSMTAGGSGTGTGGGTPPPTSPTNVVATAGDAQITITWTSVAGATGYKIYFATATGVTKTTGTQITGATSPYVHTGLTNGTTYFYVVTAINSGGESPESTEVSATPVQAVSAPNAVTGVVATPGDTQNTVTWAPVAGATSYNLYYSTTSGVTTTNGTKVTGVTSPYVHTGLTNATTYYYIVTAVNSVGEGAASSPEASATPAPAVSNPPAAPTGVIATPASGQVTISWTPVTGATSYDIYFATSTGVTTTAGTKITGVTSPYVHTGRTNGTTYYYIVVANNANGASVPSSEVNATPIATWTWSHPTPTGNRLMDVWATSGLAVAVGDAGTILLNTGSGWVQQISPVTSGLRAVWGSSATDLVACGDGGVIITSPDGINWTQAASPVTAKFNDIYGFASNDVYLVGAAGTIVRYDGTTWNDQTTASGTTLDLYGVWGSSATNVYSVGAPAGTTSAPTMLNSSNSGTTWTSIGAQLPSAVAGAYLIGIGGSSASEILAVGTGGTVVSYNGTAWSDLTASSTTANQLWKVQFVSAGNAYITGINGTLIAYSSGAFSSATTTATLSLWGLWNDSNTVYVTGTGGLILSNGGSGSTFTAQSSSVTQDVLWDVYALSANEVFVCGDNGTILHTTNGGTSWTTENTGTANHWGLWGTSATNMYICGSSGTILHRGSSGTWSTLTSGTTNALFEIWGSGANDIWICGPSGLLLHSTDGTTWSLFTGTTTTNGLNRIYGSGPNDVYAVGDAGTILHSTDGGATWPAENSGTNAVNLYGVWCDSTGTNVYACGDNGQIFTRGTGGTWTTSLNGANRFWQMYDSGAGSTNIFVGGVLGTMYNSTNGTSWTQQSVPTAYSIYEIHGSGQTYYAVGQNGMILKYQ